MNAIAQALEAMHHVRSAYQHELSLQEIFSTLLALKRGEPTSSPHAESLAQIVPTLDLTDLAALFQHSFADRATRDRGIIYTPAPLATLMVDELLARWDGPTPPHLLDPAAGSGMFLICALRALHRRYRQRSAWELLSYLHGVDREESACQAARTLLITSAQELSGPVPETSVPVTPSIKVGNSLLSSEQVYSVSEGQSLQSFDWQLAFPEQLGRGGFDLIIANPPYGLSRDGRVPSAENAALKRAYREFRTGKVNRYLLFMARSWQLLAPRGAVSLLVPNAWLGIRAGEQLRQMLLMQGAIVRITELGSGIFGDPSVEPVIVELSKSPQQRIVVRTRMNSGEVREKFSLSTTDCLNHPSAVIPLEWDAEGAELLATLRGKAILLGSPESPFLPRIALQAYATGKGTPPQTTAQVKQHLFHTRVADQPCCVPYLEGRDIARFSLCWSGSYLKYGPWLAEPQPLERFTSPRVIVREILSPAPQLISAVFCDQPFIYNRSALHILGRPLTSVEQLQALTALLNSSLISFVIIMAGRKSQRTLFPKLVNDDLRALPLPTSFAAAVPCLAELTRAAQQVKGNPTEIDARINQAVFELFGLTASQQQTVHRALNDRVQRKPGRA